MTRVLLAILEFYRRWISPALHALGGGGGCRFVPTCSEYATIAIAAHGPLHGSGLAIGRLLRCHPFCRGGLDPVPVATRDNNRVSGNLVPPVRKQNRQTGTTAAHLPHEPLP
jgi:hypothetical protein